MNDFFIKIVNLHLKRHRKLSLRLLYFIYTRFFIKLTVLSIPELSLKESVGISNSGHLLSEYAFTVQKAICKLKNKTVTNVNYLNNRKLICFVDKSFAKHLMRFFLQSIYFFYFFWFSCILFLLINLGKNLLKDLRQHNLKLSKCT